MTFIKKKNTKKIQRVAKDRNIYQNVTKKEQ